MRGQVLEHLVVLQGELDEVVGEQIGLGARVGMHAGDLDEAFEEEERVRRGQLKVELREHVALHLQDLLARVRLVGDVHEVAALGRVDLLVLGRDEHRRDADQLQVAALDLLLLEVAIDQVDGQVQGLRHQLELQVHLDEPVDEDRAHLLVDVLLLCDVGGRSEVDRLRAETGAGAAQGEGGAWSKCACRCQCRAPARCAPQSLSPVVGSKPAPNFA